MGWFRKSKNYKKYNNKQELIACDKCNVVYNDDVFFSNVIKIDIKTHSPNSTDIKDFDININMIDVCGKCDLKLNHKFEIEIMTFSTITGNSWAKIIIDKHGKVIENYENKEDSAFIVINTAQL